MFSFALSNRRPLRHAYRCAIKAGMERLPTRIAGNRKNLFKTKSAFVFFAELRNPNPPILSLVICSFTSAFFPLQLTTLWFCLFASAVLAFSYVYARPQ